MDTVSHACFSYVVCRTSGVAKSPRAGLLAAGVAMLPDLDFLLIPFLPEVARFAFHRGPSHSLFVALVMGVAGSIVLSKGLRMPRWRVAGLFFLAWAGHILLDICTGFGVALWWPLSHARVSVDLLFVVDPLATLPLLVATLWDVKTNWGQQKGHRRIAVTGLLLFAGYAASAYGIRKHVTHEFRSRLREEGISVKKIHAEPTPFTHQLWYLCAETDDGFLITYRSVWDGDDWERWRTVPRNQTPLQTFASHPLLDKMAVVLEDGFTSQVIHDNHLEVTDLRLGKRYGWEDDEAPFLFVYDVSRTSEGNLTWEMEKPKSRYDYGRLSALFARVTGKIPPHRQRKQYSRKAPL